MIIWAWSVRCLCCHRHLSARALPDSQTSGRLGRSILPFSVNVSGSGFGQALGRKRDHESSVMRRSTAAVTRSHRVPMKGNASFAREPIRSIRFRRIIERPRCKRTFTFSSVNPSASAVSAVLSSSTSRSISTERYCSGSWSSSSSRSLASSTLDVSCSGSSDLSTIGLFPSSPRPAPQTAASSAGRAASPALHERQCVSATWQTVPCPRIGPGADRLARRRPALRPRPPHRRAKWLSPRGTAAGCTVSRESRTAPFPRRERGRQPPRRSTPPAVRGPESRLSAYLSLRKEAPPPIRLHAEGQFFHGVSPSCNQISARRSLPAGEQNDQLRLAPEYGLVGPENRFGCRSNPCRPRQVLQHPDGLDHVPQPARHKSHSLASLHLHAHRRRGGNRRGHSGAHALRPPGQLNRHVLAPGYCREPAHNRHVLRLSRARYGNRRRRVCSFSA